MLVSLQAASFRRPRVKINHLRSSPAPPELAGFYVDSHSCRGLGNLPQQARSNTSTGPRERGPAFLTLRHSAYPPSAAMSLPEGYSAKKTKINEDKLADWLREQVTGDLEQVPGIGPANVKLLAATDRVPDKVETTYQLIGKFLSLKAAGTTCVEHCDMFYYWLQAKGVNAGRNNIVLAIAEKCEVFLPGCYDAAAYED